ncbi:hypothetical protein [Sediminibacillus massiliensis]|nr:hypothetical protein [Sediminibacillus massiliensis]
MTDYIAFRNDVEKKLKRNLYEEELEFLQWMYERYKEDQPQYKLTI